MYVQSKEVTFLIFDAYSLKDKRSVLKSLIHKIHNKYNVSIAEVNHNDLHNQGTIGLSLVANQKSICESMYATILAYMEEHYPIEILSIDDYV